MDFGKRLLEMEPDWAKGYEEAVNVFRELVHRSGTADRLMRLIPEIDPRINRVELWEAKKEGLRFLNADKEMVFEKRPFITYDSDIRASNMCSGNVFVFRGDEGTIFNSTPGDYSVKDRMHGIKFEESGYWIPLGNVVNGRMELTHMLAVYGDVSQKPGKDNRQLNFLVSVAALIHTVLYSQRVIDRGDTDSITTLWNKRRYDEDVLQAATGHVLHGRRFSLVMMDLDHFKWVNDRITHDAGSMVLGVVGSAFKRSGEFSYRYGGEELIQLQKDIGGLVSLRRLEELHDTFNPLRCDVEHVGVVPVTASFGAASAGIIRLLLDQVGRYPASPAGTSISKIVSKMRSMEPHIVEDAKRVREAEEAARRAGTRLDKIPDSIINYAEQVAKLIFQLADGAMYHTKETGRNGVGRAIVRGDKLAFERVDFTQLALSAPSAAAADPRQLSLQGPQNSHP
ncbi:MAG: GGDEF domain-containing protein [Candidatus ainarchaeum sp.]|nr:GGDEF domain-containing protein [Candidatus ainarchaeum sp.]MDD5095995.1 GGDEF domain-containing protein [Candidatus ainarchaeum sp.]